LDGTKGLASSRAAACKVAGRFGAAVLAGGAANLPNRSERMRLQDP